MKRHFPKAKATPLPTQPIEFEVERLSHEGRGVALYTEQADHPRDKQGKKVFVSFALPGERVKAKITDVQKRLEEAEMLELVSEPSPDRAAPICLHFTVCGGCSMQHIVTERQIELKQEVLASHLAHFAQLKPDTWLTPLRSLRTDYRRRSRIGVRWVAKQKRLVVGFRERKSNFLTEIQSCAVLDARVGQDFSIFKTLIESLHAKDAISHLEVALGDHEVAMILRHTAPLSERDQTILVDFVKQHDWQLYLQGDERHLKRVDDASGLPYLHYGLAQFGLNFAFSPLDFTQVNATINAQMIQLACDLLNLQAGERVLDLFCGLGNFSLPLAQQVGETGAVVGVEGSLEMVQRSALNAQENGIFHANFYMQDLTQDFSHQVWAKQGFDAILIDPPRAGAEEIMQYLPKFGAKRVVYVSCNPATLARDANLLTQHGYRLVKAGVMDMFTHTGHVESIALFEKH